MSIIKRSDFEQRFPEIYDEFYQLSIENPGESIKFKYKYIHNGLEDNGSMSSTYYERSHSKTPGQDSERQSVPNPYYLPTHIMQTLSNIRIYSKHTKYTFAEYSIEE